MKTIVIIFHIIIFSSAICSAQENDGYLVGPLEQIPEIYGSYDSLFQAVKTNLTLPKSCESGRTFITFLIKKDGKVTNPKVLKSVCPEVDQTLIKLVTTLKFHPGKYQNEVVEWPWTIPFEINSP